MKKLLIRFYFWYLYNYRGLHHTISLVMLFLLLYFMWGWSIFGEFFLCSLALVLNYFATNWSIKKVGLDKTIEEEIKRLFEKNSINSDIKFDK